MEIVLVASSLVLSVTVARAQLTTDFCSSCCPNIFQAALPVVRSAIEKKARMGAFPRLLRQWMRRIAAAGRYAHLHRREECCSEQELCPARGFEVIDQIKATVERECPGVVSCANLGGPYWDVKLGRRDARTASQASANNSIPPPTSNLNQLISFFQNVGVAAKDMVVLSGSPFIGQARQGRTIARSNGVGDNNLAPLDLQTPTYFDNNNYYKNLLQRKGLLHSDQQLYNGGSTDSIVKTYGESQSTFLNDFVNGMIRMGDIKPLTGSKGEVRKNSRKVN
ncbi:hypothetical protein MLD38_002703 [Melastoma candidum]|uniref:Uncharacterized protein n=1 Tax=Melastoma candidum TaxID=119954 RepID=A0ACB9S1J5_9MYRT|nr:hypothetical protein MLD38_002703 [Melastoma candidum]